MQDFTILMPPSTWGFTPPSSIVEAREKFKAAKLLQADCEGKLASLRKKSNQVHKGKKEDELEALNAERMLLLSAFDRGRALVSYLALWLMRSERRTSIAAGRGSVTQAVEDCLLPLSSSWDKPQSIEKAEDRIYILNEEMWTIGRQLSDNSRKDPATGERFDSLEYHDWEYQARYAKIAKTCEIRYLNLWLQWRRMVESGKGVAYLAEVTAAENELLPSHKDFVRPRTLREAREWLLTAEDAADKISFQLSCPDCTDPETGELIDEEDYLVWRTKAAGALAINRASQIFLNEWISRFQCLRDGAFWLEPFTPDPKSFAWYPVEAERQPPVNLLEALDRLLDVRIAVAKIYAHLTGDSQVDQVTWMPFSDKRFAAWEAKSKVAVVEKTCELIFLQRWVAVAKADLAHQIVAIPMGDAASVIAAISPYVPTELLLSTLEALEKINCSWQGPGERPASTFAANKELFELTYKVTTLQAKLITAYRLKRCIKPARQAVVEARPNQDRITALNHYFNARCGASQPLCRALLASLQASKSVTFRQREAILECLHCSLFRK